MGMRTRKSGIARLTDGQDFVKDLNFGMMESPGGKSFWYSVKASFKSITTGPLHCATLWRCQLWAKDESKQGGKSHLLSGFTNCHACMIHVTR